MNKRIKELYKEAYGVQLPIEDFVLDCNEKKFAESIVRECLSIAHREHKNALEFEWDNDDTAQIIRDSISEHFGVKE